MISSLFDPIEDRVVRVLNTNRELSRGHPRFQTRLAKASRPCHFGNSQNSAMPSTHSGVRATAEGEFDRVAIVDIEARMVDRKQFLSCIAGHN